jgi:GxxExxY protein
MSGSMFDRQGAKNAKGLGLNEPSNSLDVLARRVIGAAIEVHRTLGPGFLETIYEEAIAVEFELRRISFERQPGVDVTYKGRRIGMGRPDFIVGGSLIVEIKAARQLLPVHSAQVISYLKAMKTPLGLLLNFHERIMRRGIRRVVFSSAASGSDESACDVDER